jgi:LAO/AO transport system kinase
MVDFFLLLMIAGAGDELQGIKKGIMELADALLVNKADGDNKIRANAARADYNRALHYLAPATEGWYTKAYTCSSLNGEGIDAIWKVIGDFRQHVTKKRRVRETPATANPGLGVLDGRGAFARQLFQPCKGVGSIRKKIEEAVLNGHIPPTVAAQQLIHKYEGR